MSRKLYPAALAGTLALGALMASAYTFKEYRMLPAERLHVPAMPDSVMKENPFKTEDLLKSRDILPDPAAAGWTTMVADSTGQLRLVGEKDLPALHTYTTRLRADRFAKGKLVLNATGRATVKVNGETKITKTTTDSTAQDSDCPIELMPSRDYDISVDLLTAPDDKAEPTFSLRYEPDADYTTIDVHGVPTQSKRVSPLTTMQGERGMSAKLSDNGKYLIFITREVISQNETKWRGSLRDAVSGKTISDGISYRAQWMPGRDAFFYTTPREGKYDVYVTEVPSMRTSLLAKDIPDDDVSFSPDGRYMFYYKQVEADKQSGPMHRYSQPDDRMPQDRDRMYIMRYDTKSRVTIPLTYGGATTSIYNFTNDGSKMLYGSTRQTPDRYPFYLTTLVEMDMNTLACDTIAKDMESTPTSVTYSPDGKELFVTAGPNAFGGIGANFAPHEIGNDFDGQGYIYDIATGKARAMTRDFDPAIEAPVVWNAVNGQIYFCAEEGFNKPLFTLNPKSGKITKLNTEVPNIRTFSIGDKEAARLAYVGGSFTRDGAAYMLDLKSGKSTLVADPLAEFTKDVQFGDMKQWIFTAKDGTKVDGYMCTPPDFDASKKYPLIVYYYGGTSPSNASFYHLYSPQVFASRGYVVYVLNPSGTTGYGQEYSARHVNAWGKRTADEIIEGTKKFCAEHPFVDSKKIGCIGASYGGFMTQYLQTLTDIFACAVSHAGISNVTSYWGEGYWGYSYNSVAAAKHYPWSDPDLYTKQGSLFNADKIHTPLLLLHGTEDTNVPIGESIQLFNALKILGREVEFITVQDENHVISGFDNKLAWQNTIMAWFAKWLQDDPHWWNELYK
jgi:dipeptidyl aminopeptidase/acylaminoacyl peptidase